MNLKYILISKYYIEIAFHHNFSLHFIKIKALKTSSVRRLRLADRIEPPTLNTLSIGALVAGMLKIYYKIY